MNDAGAAPTNGATVVSTRARVWRSAPVRVPVGVLLVGLAYATTALLGALVGSREPRALFAAVTYLGSAAVGLGLYVLFTRVVERRPAADELRWRDARAMLPLGLAIGAAFMTVVVGAIAALGAYRIDALRPATVLWAPLLLSVWSGVVEELLFRGVVFRVIEERRGSWFALSFSAFLFGAVHLMNPNADVLGAVAIALEAGLMLAACYMAFRTLWVSIGVHIAWNFTEGGVFGIAVSGNDLQGLFVPRTDGPSWLTGGAFGAEASLPSVILGMLLFAVFLARARRLGRIVGLAEARAATMREHREDATIAPTHA